MKITPKLLTLLVIVFLAGCSSYPLELSKTEWDSMSPARQTEYRKLQKIADNQKRQDVEGSQRQTEQSVRQIETASNR